jgi:hypothetical protein
MLQLGSSFGGSGADFRSAAIFPYQETKLVVLFVLESYFIYAGADWSDLLSLLRGTVLPADLCEDWTSRAGFDSAYLG